MLSLPLSSSPEDEILIIRWLQLASPWKRKKRSTGAGASNRSFNLHRDIRRAIAAYAIYLPAWWRSRLPELPHVI